mgnify:CR=1 FL=1
MGSEMCIRDSDERLRLIRRISASVRILFLPTVKDRKLETEFSANLSNGSHFRFRKEYVLFFLLSIFIHPNSFVSLTKCLISFVSFQRANLSVANGSCRSSSPYFIAACRLGTLTFIWHVIKIKQRSHGGHREKILGKVLGRRCERLGTPNFSSARFLYFHRERSRAQHRGAPLVTPR